MDPRRLRWYRDVLGIDESRLRIRTTRRRSSPTTVPGRRISNTCSRGAGASSKESRHAQTSTSTSHGKESGHPLTYFDEETREHIVPWVIEPAAG